MFADSRKWLQNGWLDYLAPQLYWSIDPNLPLDQWTKIDELVTDADGWTLRTRDGSLAAHCEHTLVITKGEPLILAA